MADTEVIQKLVEAIKQGDKAAFGRLYDSYSAALYGICLQILGDEEEAQDALQSAMIKAWRNFRTFDSKKAGLYTWLLNITRNECIDRLRSRGRKPKIQDLGKSVTILEKQGNVSQDNVRVDTIGLKQAVEQLDSDLKQVIDAAYFLGYTQQEIADEFGIPLGTVKTRMRIAIRELRKVLI